ncbi:MAG: hypothetical protein KDE05_01310 [Parvularculaceae bacterium]|nr:hypothetical protein [Parvularculaceae bacterium]
MEKNNKTKFFSRSNLLVWGPVIFGVLSVQVIFGWKDGLTGITWNVVPIVFGLFICIAFLWLGRFLSARMGWLLQLLVLAAISLASVAAIFALLVVTTSQDPINELGLFLPGQTMFYLILFFSVILTGLGFCRRIPRQKS